MVIIGNHIVNQRIAAMPEAARCPKCHWGRLTYPLEIEAGQCVGCMGKRVKAEPVREVYRSEDNMYGQRGVLDDD